MLGLYGIKLFVFLTHLEDFALAFPIGANEGGALQTVNKWTSASYPILDVVQDAWIIPGICPGGFIVNTDEDSLWSSIQYLQLMPSPQTETKCTVPPHDHCYTAACTNIKAGHPGAGGSSIISICNDSDKTIRPTCNVVGIMAQYLVGLCRVWGPDSGLSGQYNVTSGQIFDSGGWNVINNYDPNLCTV